MAKAKAKGWDEFKVAKASIDQICEHVASGESLNSFCKAKGFAYVTVLDWINVDDSRSEKYAHARETRADLVFESLDDVSDQAARAKSAVTVAGLRLKADNIKWKLARMAPKKYGDRTTLAGDAENPLAILTMDKIAANPKSRLAVK